MKIKILFSYVIIVFVFCMFFLNSKKQIVNAVFNDPFPKWSGVSHKQYDHFLQSYFENLKENFAENKYGSCGYVAMEMVLTYYDTYLNDSIVPSNFECFTPTSIQDMSLYGSSPGSLNDKNLVSGMTSLNSGLLNELANLYISDSYYNNYILQHTNDSLHAKLCNIAYNNNIGKVLGLMQFGTIQSDLIGVLNHYLQEEINLSNNDYSIPFGVFVNTTLSQNNCKEYIKSIIDEGIPAIVGLIKANDISKQHYAVAYDYDDITNKIFCNYGYHDSSPSYHRDYTLDNYYISDVTYIRFNNNYHSHSYKYKIYDSLGIIHNLCYDSPYIYTYNHTHNTNYRYDYLNQINHKCMCQCEDNYILRPHVVDINETGQFADCLLCGVAIDIWQNPVIGGSFSPLYSANGSILLPNGVIKLHPLDFYNYLNNTLIFSGDNYE